MNQIRRVLGIWIVCFLCLIGFHTVGQEFRAALADHTVMQWLAWEVVFFLIAGFVAYFYRDVRLTRPPHAAEATSASPVDKS